MGIKSFFNGLFGHADNQMPSSLGNGVSKEQNTINLGGNIQHPEQNETSSPKDEQDPAKDDEKGKTPESDAKISPTSATYNLIILDESGSMSGVRSQTISGCNETLNSIRNTAKDQPEIEQFVSIFCFDTSNSRYIFQDVPIEDTRDLTPEDYCPNSCTPLYDAVGYTVTELHRLIEKTDSVGVVTIITDGYENASRRWNHHSVVELIDSLKKKGWVFTFIGANIDVEETAKGLGIDSYMKFEQTDEGMSAMFEEERRSRRAYSEKRRYMSRMAGFCALEDEERQELLGAMNKNYFVNGRRRIAPDCIKELGPEGVFVFGSNILGKHNGGAALYALEHFGAIDGQAEGIQGRSYAIPTDGNTFEELKEAVGHFTDYVVMHPQKIFMLTAIGCGSAGYTPEQIAPLFQQAYSFGNVYIPESFFKYMPQNPNI